MPGFAARVRKYYLKRNGERGASTAQMDDANRGICYALRFPPDGSKPTKLNDIRKVVRKKNGQKPTLQAIALAASSYKDEKGLRGRPLGSKATTKAEDKKIMQVFHKWRPPGHGIVARQSIPICPNACRRKLARKR